RRQKRTRSSPIMSSQDAWHGEATRMGGSKRGGLDMDALLRRALSLRRRISKTISEIRMFAGPGGQCPRLQRRVASARPVASLGGATRRALLESVARPTNLCATHATVL